MKKKFCCLFMVVVFMLSGCSDNEYSIYERINKRYYSLASYKAEGNITYYTNKTKNKYSFIEYFNGDTSHLIHYTDDDLKVCVREDGVFLKYLQRDKAVRISDTDEGYRYIFPDCFFESYYLKETSAFDSDSEYVILETDCSDGAVSSMKMWIDTHTLDPYKIHIYDSDSDIVCEISFTSFDTDTQISDELFEF